ncbi:MAG: carboxypeptidase-like regulatory domain-containing protein [Bacteroidota bacterium]
MQLTVMPNRTIYHILLVLMFTCLQVNLLAQEATVKGYIFNKESKKALPDITIAVKGIPGFSNTDSTGKFSLNVPAERDIIIVVKNIGFKEVNLKRNYKAGSINELNVDLESNVNTLGTVQIEDKQARSSTLTRIDPKLLYTLPTTGGFEAILKTLPGVSSNNELSSQYNVRGGNYDENLIYVNDIEIYRPFLVRSGQQEGLSFINADMVSSILFSAGGFDAKYGDKLSSVLDVQYRNPRTFGGTVQGSLLGGSLHLEGISKDARFSAIGGIRTRTNQYLLRTLDTQGDYKPFFADGQLLLNYDFTPEFSLQALGNYSRNRYNMVPQSRQTKFGTVNEALQLNVYFDGQEVNDFETYLGALTGIYKPNRDLKLKFITSAFRSYEFETYDVQGQYYIDQLETDLSKPNFGDVKFNRGVGTFLNHARNYLTSTVVNAEHKGFYKNATWGAKFQHEIITDKLSEWQNIDSAGYSLPQSNLELLELKEVIKQKIDLESNRLMGYYQNHWSWQGKDTSEYRLTLGARTNYWTLNKQLLISPRGTFSVKPNWKRDFLFRFSSGIYSQPAFYRELRNFKGEINRNLKAQQSIHFVLGSDYNFKIWNRPFKLLTEVYYKQLNNLVPYEIDNVRIRYYAENLAKGYATGVDMKLNGEFINGIESWFSLSVMKTAEDINNDFYYAYYNSDNELIRPGITANAIATDSILFRPGFIRRPADQRVNVGMFFQDYVPKIPKLKMHLNLLYGTGFPFGPPSYERYKDTLKMPPYRRVDIGFSWQLISEDQKLPQKNLLHYFKSMWLSIEVFNLLAINNTISYLWIKDITDRQYAIPNYLTNRQVNVRLVTKF